MKCPFCGFEEDRVIDSRSCQEGRAVRRRRECLGCHQRFTTYEYIERSPLMVVKRDGRREPFDREKLLAGVVKACRKRPVSMDDIEAMVNEIEAELSNPSVSEVTSLEIGEKVMERLRRVDEVSYVRFASVYRKFRDTSEFMEELKGLLGKE
jgi:transcriptional repressor NrdR